MERVKSATLKPYTLFLRILSVIWSVIHAFETSNASRDIWKLLHDVVIPRINRPIFAPPNTTQTSFPNSSGRFVTVYHINPPACCRALWILPVRSWTVCLVLDFPLVFAFRLHLLPRCAGLISTHGSHNTRLVLNILQLLPLFFPPSSLCLPPACCVVSYVQYLT